MVDLAGDAECQGLVIAAFEHLDLAGREQAKVLKKIEKSLILLVDAKNHGGFSGMKLRKKNASLFAKLRNTAAYRNPVRTCFMSRKAF